MSYIGSWHMTFILFFLYLSIFVLGVYRFPKTILVPQTHRAIGLVIKGLFALIFVVIFQEFYGAGTLYGDAYEFMKDAKTLHLIFFENPLDYVKALFELGDLSPSSSEFLLNNTNIWTTGNNGDFINDNRLIIKLNSIFYFFSNGSPYIHALFFSMLSYLGILLIHQSIIHLVARPILFFYALILFPSIGFWGSGIGKEALLILGLGIFLSSIKILTHKVSLKGILILILGGFLLLVNKPYAGLFIFGFASYFLFSKIPFIRYPRLIYVLTIGLIFIGSITIFPERVNTLHKISYKQKDLINLGRGGIFYVNDTAFCAFDFKHLQNFQISKDSITVLRETPGEYKLFGQKEFHDFDQKPSEKKFEKYLVQAPSNSYIPAQKINYSIGTLIALVPQAFLNVLIRPYPWDPGSQFKHLAFLSNLLLLVLLVLAVFRRKKEKVSTHWVFYLGITSLAIILIIGWTIPILGAIVRYKMIVDLLLLMVIFILWSNKNSSSSV